MQKPVCRADDTVGDKNNGRNSNWTFTTAVADAGDLHAASLDEALVAARPVLLRLYQTWQALRRAQVTDFVVGFVAHHGHLPTPAQVRAGIDPPFRSDRAAAYYLEAVRTPDLVGDRSGMFGRDQP